MIGDRGNEFDSSKKKRIKGAEKRSQLLKMEAKKRRCENAKFLFLDSPINGKNNE